jgi:hypothetical protein
MWAARGARPEARSPVPYLRRGIGCGSARGRSARGRSSSRSSSRRDEGTKTERGTAGRLKAVTTGGGRSGGGGGDSLEAISDDGRTNVRHTHAEHEHSPREHFGRVARPDAAQHRGGVPPGAPRVLEHADDWLTELVLEEALRPRQVRQSGLCVRVCVCVCVCVRVC